MGLPTVIEVIGPQLPVGFIGEGGPQLRPREVPGVHVQAIPDNSFGQGASLHRRAPQCMAAKETA